MRTIIHFRNSHSVVRTARFAGELLMSVTSAMGKNVPESADSAEEVDSWAGAIGDMLCAYLREIDHG